MVFPVVMYECESWTIKKTEHRRILAFYLWCWRRLLRVPQGDWSRRSIQSILEKISPEYSFEGLMLKLKLQYFGHLMWKANSLEKTLMLGKIEGRRRSGWQRMRWHHWLNGHEFKANPERYRRLGKPGVLQSMGSQRVRHNSVTEQQHVTWEKFISLNFAFLACKMGTKSESLAR